MVALCCRCNIYVCYFRRSGVDATLIMLTAADFSRWSSGSSFIGSSYFDVSNIMYDDTGSIITRRRGGGDSSVIADNLTFIYGGFKCLMGIIYASGVKHG